MIQVMISSIVINNFYFPLSLAKLLSDSLTNQSHLKLYLKSTNLNFRVTLHNLRFLRDVLFGLYSYS